MDLSFAKDSKKFSAVVEALRAQAIPMTEENIRKAYESDDFLAEEEAEAEAEAEAPSDDIDASDAAQKLAEENGIDLASIKGSGANGNITVSDVRDAIKATEE